MFPFDNKEHTLIIGDSFRSERQYDMIRYDFKPKSIDSEKEGILETDERACTTTVRLPHTDTGKAHVFEGKRESCAGKQCLIIVNHETGEITIERVNTHQTVKLNRGSTGETFEFKPRTRKPAPSTTTTSSSTSKSSGTTNTFWSSPENPPVAPEPSRKRAPKANRNVPSPVVRPKIAREEEQSQDIELPSIIKPEFEPPKSSSGSFGILGLGSPTPPAAKKSESKQPVKAAEGVPGLFSTSEESESDSSEEDSSNSSGSERNNSSSDNSDADSDDQSEKPPVEIKTESNQDTNLGLGLDLSDDDDEDSD